MSFAKFCCVSNINVTSVVWTIIMLFHKICLFLSLKNIYLVFITIILKNGPRCIYFNNFSLQWYKTIMMWEIWNAHQLNIFLITLSAIEILNYVDLKIDPYRQFSEIFICTARSENIATLNLFSELSETVSAIWN